MGQASPTSSVKGLLCRLCQSRVNQLALEPTALDGRGEWRSPVGPQLQEELGVRNQGLNPNHREPVQECTRSQPQ